MRVPHSSRSEEWLQRLGKELHDKTYRPEPVRRVMIRLQLTLNTTKTCVRDARKETFDFLGYTFGWQMAYSPKGVWGMDARPSKKCVQRLKRKLHEVLRPWNVGPWEDVAGRVNRMVMGWSHYFAYGTLYPAYRVVDNHLYDRVRHFLRRRHKVASRGTTLLPTGKHLKAWGVVRLLDVLYARRPAYASG